MRRDMAGTIAGIAVIVLMARPAAAQSGELGGRLLGWLGVRHADMTQPAECDQCGCSHDAEGPCVERTPVTECRVGKKELHRCEIRYEYESVPETRYRWRMKFVKKEVPCEYCKPVCNSEDVEHCYEAEKWQAEPSACGDLHCKVADPVTEKVPCKHCGQEPGKTVVRVCVFTCVKEPYTIYRRVKKPVCVKQPYYERVEVPVTRHICRAADGHPCDCDACCESEGQWDAGAESAAWNADSQLPQSR